MMAAPLFLLGLLLGCGPAPAPPLAPAPPAEAAPGGMLSVDCAQGSLSHAEERFCIAMGTVSPVPSFACSAAETPTEHAVCGSEELARLDRANGALYAQAAARGVPGLVSGQKRFLRQRDACADDLDCLVARYLERLAVLGAHSGDPWAGQHARGSDGDLYLFGTGSEGERLAYIHVEAPGYACEVRLLAQELPRDVLFASAPDAIDQPCQFALVRTGDQIAVTAAPGCPYFCSGGGSFEGRYVRVRE